MRLPSVAIITPGTFPIPSGASSSVERVVEYMASLAAERVHIQIYAKRFQDQGCSDLVRGVSCERVEAVNSHGYIQQVLRQLDSFDPDIIQIENRPRYVLAVRAARPAARIWLNLHSTTFIHSGHISKRALKQAMRECEIILVNSRYLYNQVARAAPECKKRIVVNPLGVDQERFISRWSQAGKQQYLELRQDQGWEDRQLILFAGRLIPLKGVHHLLHAVPHVIRKYPRALFVIVGGASYGRTRKTNYIRRLEQLGRRYPQHVRFIPYVSHEEMPRWYGAADLAVVPSVRRESFGLVNVEAMASGVPVIATRVGGIQEVVQHQITGVLMRPNRIGPQLVRALNQLLGDEQLRERMGRAGAELVGNSFTWRQMAERWENEIYACGRFQ